MEEWRDIVGYEGFYQVSNLGNVRSFAHYQGKWDKVYTRKNPFMLRQTPDKEGYFAVILSNHGVAKRFLVHRLVAIAFIENPKNLPLINHKDENPANNHVDNLEWCSQIYNLNYGQCLLKKRTSMMNCVSVSRAIRAYFDGGGVYTYPSMNEASRTLKISWLRIRRSAKLNVKVPNTNIRFSYI